MLKSRHRWSDTSFINLIRMLADTYPEDNKLPANTYRAKKIIRSVSMKLKKFHACSNHYILYRSKYENLQSCPHNGSSWYKRNVGCHANVDDERPKSRSEASPHKRRLKCDTNIGPRRLMTHLLHQMFHYRTTLRGSEQRNATIVRITTHTHTTILNIKRWSSESCAMR